MTLPVLYIPLMGTYFDQIKAGEKPEEFRKVSPYWAKRLVDREYAYIELTRGYPAKSDMSRRLRRAWRGFSERTITHEHFGRGPVAVYAIDVSVLHPQNIDQEAG
ncbi:ASCH domain-containing protein [Ruegeria lacuscaerulensis]|uniref:ASCH domain-containing protein n=1 Tax=Ruegeria lacuscaerulensis TaxID=55218 RepID=UPI00147EBAD7|nr:ASCH domain-containing protein [Ruegeria lacuscaerulensis]